MKSFFPYAVPHQQQHARRIFLSQMLKASLASAFAISMRPAFASNETIKQERVTVGAIMDMLLKEIPGAPFANTVDTLKSGSKEIEVTGIVTTMFATIDIIRKSIAQGANFIIAHEPTFYNHTDDKAWVDPNHIVQQKQELLEKNRVCVWRLHDYLHSFVPDGVQYGVVKKAGWLSYYTSGSPLLKLPSTTLEALALHLKKTLGIEKVRVIGKLAQKCEHIALMPGAAGGQRQIAMVEKERPDVLIVGEVHEWEAAEYIRDTQQLGEKTGLIVLGHSVSEEPGLEWLQGWLQQRLPAVRTTHLPSGNPFVFV